MDGGALRVVLVFAVATFLVSCGSECPDGHPLCPHISPSFTVVTSPEQSLVGVEATIGSNAFACTPTQTGAICTAESPLDSMAGLLHVTAPGFQPVAVDSSVERTPAEACGCATDSRRPSTVTLNPS